MNKLKKYALAFDDVAIVPCYTKVASRADVSTKTKLGRLELDIPVISSPMDSITGAEMARTMRELGGLGILHRFCSIEEEVKAFSEAVTIEELTRELPRVGVAIGLSEGLERAWALYDAGARIFCLDVANGFTEQVAFRAKELKTAFPDSYLILGNVCTKEGYVFLENNGADAARVGIGSGSACTTRIQTGVGVPQFTAVLDCWMGRTTPVISDGGHRHPGDVAKAIAAGAGAVMIGGMFAGCSECPWAGGEPKGIFAYDKKFFRGMASKDVTKSIKGSLPDWQCAEGVVEVVEHRGPVENVVKNILGGLRSAMTYCGATTIEEFQENSEFIQVTAAGYAEGEPHVAKCL